MAFRQYTRAVWYEDDCMGVVYRDLLSLVQSKEEDTNSSVIYAVQSLCALHCL